MIAPRICIFTCREPAGTGAMTVRSARWHHPHSTIVHLTDTHSPGLEDVDQVWRAEWDGDLATLFLCRAKLLTMLNAEPTVILDSDTLVCAPLGEAFDEGFDVGLCERDKDLRYNAGVMFSRNPAFWTALLERMEGASRHFMMTEVALQKEVESGKWNVRNLDCREWNNYWLDRQSVPEARVLHYKGGRKKWLAKHYRDGVWRAEKVAA